jgi:hypothetical protein
MLHELNDKRREYRYNQLISRGVKKQPLITTRIWVSTTSLVNNMNYVVVVIHYWWKMSRIILPRTTTIRLCVVIAPIFCICYGWCKMLAKVKEWYPILKLKQITSALSFLSRLTANERAIQLERGWIIRIWSISLVGVLLELVLCVNMKFRVKAGEGPWSQIPIIKSSIELLRSISQIHTLFLKDLF